ncbi:MAG: hypothetical protein K8S99_16985 [Planctomycetes bacterium]|nr:hypothetical protein [Planctomycetota bacterium]
MNAQALADELNVLLTTETRSLVRHLNEARPYLTPRTFPIWKKIEGMMHDNDIHAAHLNTLLEGVRITPRPVSYNSEVASYHFLTLDSLIPLLIEEKQSQVAAYQRALEHASASPADPDLCDELSHLLTEVRGHLDVLEGVRRDLPEGSPIAGRH